MKILYKIAIWTYGLILNGFSPFHAKAKSFGIGRTNLFSKLKSDVSGHQGKLIWIHAASVGEFEQARPIIERLKIERPVVKVLVTFFSPSGYELRKTYPLADFIYYLPLDTRNNARQFLNITQPSVAVFIKYEFWYFFLEQLQQRKIPTFVVSAVFRPNQWFFHSTGRFLWKKIKKIDWFFVQDEDSLKLLQSKGLERTELSGDTRIDRVIQVKKEGQEVAGISAFKARKKLMILGSIWPEDLKILEPFIRSNDYGMKWVIAPHEMDEGFLKRLDDLPDSMRYTEFIDSSKVANILILDTVGQLAACYQYSDFAYVGGGFQGALHNILEPAVFGQPVFFGEHKKNEKFVETAELIDKGGAFSFSDLEAFQLQFNQLWNDKDAYQMAADASSKYVEEKSGATKKVVKKVLETI